MSKNRLLDARPQSAAEPPGRVVHDSRGNAVWDWAVATDVLSRKTVAELLGTLRGPGALTLEGRGDAEEWAGDPYNRPAR